MKVFLTWSGENSRRIALALHDLIPKILQVVEPFISAKDVDKGTRWQSGLSAELDAATVGIICLTPDNLMAPWILFEAGALSKKIEQSPARVYTYLHKLASTDITFPLSMFQHTLATKEDTRMLLNSIRKLTGAASPNEEGLNELFELMWPKLDSTLRGLTPSETTPKREVRDMVEEILETVREMAAAQNRQVSAELWRRLRSAENEIDEAADAAEVNRSRPNKSAIDLMEALRKSLAELPQRKQPIKDAPTD